MKIKYRMQKVENNNSLEAERMYYQGNNRCCLMQGNPQGAYVQLNKKVNNMSQKMRYLIEESRQRRGLPEPSLSSPKVKMKFQPKKVEQSAILPIVGLIVTSWYNSRGKLVSKNYGTGFAVTPWLIMTCSHNIFASVLQRVCDQVLFYPDAHSSTAFHKTQAFKARSVVEEDYSNINFQSNPTPQQLHILVLDRPLNSQSNFPTLTNFHHLKLTPEKMLHIVGFPTNQPKSQRKGFLYSTPQNQNQYQIQYKIQTKLGMSGSPVLINQQWGWNVVGIHTHQGQTKEYNAGLYFSNSILSKIKKIEENILYLKDRKRIKFLEKDSSEEKKEKQKKEEKSSFDQCNEANLSLKSRDWSDLMQDSDESKQEKEEVQQKKKNEKQGAAQSMNDNQEDLYQDYNPNQSQILSLDDSFSNKSAISVFDDWLGTQEEKQEQ